MLPEKIFFTGVPGSAWSQIAQAVEQIPGFNTSDRTPERTYIHQSGARHLGAYFGTGMEFNCNLPNAGFESAWSRPGGTKLIKSHEWALDLKNIKQQYSSDWIMMVYRPTDVSYRAWVGAGGFDISYPAYGSYATYNKILESSTKQNNCLLDFAKIHNLRWHKFTPQWCMDTFGHETESDRPVPDDLLVTLLK